MAPKFGSLIRQHSERIVREWVDGVYRDRRTQLAARLSFEQLVNSVPEILEELAYLLEAESEDGEIREAAIRLRSHSQVRFRQGALIDEVARELTVLREVINRFLWSETVTASKINLSPTSDGFRRTNLLVDEMVVQAIVIYAASLRPPVETRTSAWPPPRRRKSDFRPEEV